MANLVSQVTKNMADEVLKYKDLVGRKEELNKLIEILNRKEKANPVLIGEAGVGKTAIVEGLVKLIVSANSEGLDDGDNLDELVLDSVDATLVDEVKLSTKLLNSRIFELNVGSLVQRAAFSGSVEAVVKDFCNQIIADSEENGQIILFVDEIHLLVGQDRGPKQELSNAFKPFLARGDVRLIGATTRKEYKQIEDDKALERRFTPIMVQELSVEETVEVLRANKSIFEEFHEVEYDDATLVYMAKTAKRYMSDRSLPDSALDLLDIVGAKRNLSYGEINTSLFDMQMVDIKNRMYPLIAEDRFGEAYPLNIELNQLEHNRSEYIEESKGLRQGIITVSDVKDIVESYLGVEVAIDLSVEDELGRLRTMQEDLKSKVVGQDGAVLAVSDAVVSHRLGLRNPNKPVGSFLFYGPSGVGKTELAKQLAKLLYGDESKMLRLDMGEFQEGHTISKLLGSPAGYIGYGDGSTAFEPLRKNPNQVVLVDEFEKAHPNIQNVFLSILDDGFVKDQQNNCINFKETVLIFTTNAKPTNTVQTGAIGFGMASAKTTELVVRFNQFRPEVLNRFDGVIEFKDLTESVLKDILNLRIADLNNLYEEAGYIIEFTEPAKDLLVKNSMDKGMGARPLNRNLNNIVESNLKRAILGGRTNKHFKFGVLDGVIVLKDEPTVVNNNQVVVNVNVNN